jgi:hypothetical protein
MQWQLLYMKKIFIPLVILLSLVNVTNASQIGIILPKGN